MQATQLGEDLARGFNNLGITAAGRVDAALNGCS